MVTWNALPRYVAVATFFGLGLVGCRTASELVVEADGEVYAVVAEKRAELLAVDPFTIDSPAQALRDELIAGAELEPLDLADLLIIAADNSRNYQSERENLYLTALDFTLERWAFSAIGDASSAASIAGVGGSTTSKGLTNIFGLSKLFETGMVIAADIGTSIVSVDGRSAWNATSNAVLTITQPLWRGADSEIVTEDLVQAERNVVYEARSYERFRRTFAVDIAALFFGILRQRDTLENERENFRGLTRLRERNEAFAEAGRLNEIQVDQASQDELRARDRVIGALRNLEASLDDFKFVLGLPTEVALPIEEGDWLMLERWPFLLVEIDEDLAIDVALEQRLDHATIVDQLEDIELDARIAADNLRAGIDFFAVNTNSSRVDDPDDYSSELRTWAFGIDIDWPIDLLPERNAYRASLIAVDRAKRAIEASRDDIIASVRANRRDVEAARESYEIQIRAVELAERRVQSTELNLEAGRADTRDVLESQESLVLARNSLTAALVGYILSGLELYQDMELLRVTPAGITVDLSPVELYSQDTLP